MRKLLVLCGTILCLSITAVAQDVPAAFDASSPASEPAAPVTFAPSGRAAWQLGIGYQYQHYNVLGQAFHTNGFNTDFTRYLNNWVGVEGAVAMGFGRTGTPSFVAKSIFLGGGPHISIHTEGRLEPWVHALVGWEHFRFTQSSGTLGSNSAFGLMGGGGVDFKIGSRAYWRLQGDYIGTRFQSAFQTNYSIGSGIVFNF